MDKIEDCIETLSKKAAEAKLGSEAMHFAQAALNLANARCARAAAKKTE